MSVVEDLQELIRILILYLLDRLVLRNRRVLALIFNYHLH